MRAARWVSLGAIAASMGLAMLSGNVGSKVVRGTDFETACGLGRRMSR